jgi:hypothetical protein
MTLEERQKLLAENKASAEERLSSLKEVELHNKALKYAEMEWRMGLEKGLIVAIKELGDIDEDKIDNFINTLQQALLDAKYNSMLESQNLENSSKAKGRLFKSRI